MKGADFEIEINASIHPDERLDDVALMIDIIAAARAGDAEKREADYFFAAAIICVLLEPLKPDTYKEGVLQMRRAFNGIADNKEKRMLFEGSLTPTLRNIEGVEEALKLSPERLFTPVYSYA